MRLSTFTPLLLSAGLLTGCAVGPDYARPAVATPPAFMGQAAIDGRQTGAPPTELLTWWNGFGDPLLSRFIATALDQNLDLAQATARVTQARASLGSAHAALLPSGQVSA